MALISTLIVALTARTTDFEQNLRSTEKMLDRVSSRVDNLGTSIAVGLSAPLAAAGAGSVAMAVEFEESTSKLTSLLGLTNKETMSLRDNILKLAGETAQAPTTLGEALTKVEMAGLRGEQALDVVKAAAMGAATGLGSASNIADVLTAELNAYGPAAIGAGRATAVLIDAVKTGRTTGDALAGSLGNLIPLAAQMGVSFDQLVGGVTAMTRSGMEAGAATTALRSILTTIEKPSKAAQEALGEVGLSAKGLRDEIQSDGLGAALHTLGAALQGNDRTITALFPNARALSGVLAILGQSAKGTSDTFSTLARATEADLGKSFAAAAEGPGFKFKQALTEIQVLTIRLGDEILPTVVPLVQAFAGVIERLADRFAQLTPGARDLLVVVGSIGAAVAPTLLAFSALYTAAATTLGVLRLFLGLTGLANVFQAAWIAATALGGAMLELGGYFLTFGVAETIAGVILPSLTAGFVAVRGALAALTITPITAFFSTLFNIAVDAGVGIAGLAATISGPAILAFGLMAIAAGLIYSRWNELKTDLGIIFNWIVDQVKDTFVGKIISYIGQFSQRAADILARFGISLKTMTVGAYQAVADGAADLGGRVKDGLGAGFDAVLAAAQKWASGLIASMHGVAAQVAPALAQTGDSLVELKTTVIDTRSAWDIFEEGVDEAVGNVKSTFTGLAAQMHDTGAAMQAQMRSMASATASSMGAMTASFLQGKTNIGQFVTEMVEQIGILIVKLLILQALTSSGLGGPFASGLIGGLNFGPGHAIGGRVNAGTVYPVGEAGPELFVSDTAGTIVPNGGGGAGGGGTTVIVQQTVQIDGLDLGSAQAASRLATAIKEQARSGSAEGVSLALALAQTAQQHGGRSS